MPALRTERLELVPVTVALVQAVMAGDRAGAEAVVAARFPAAWPGSDLIARAFHPLLEAITADPARRLWGDTLLVAPLAPLPRSARSLSSDRERRVVGSVIFHGRPDDDGIAEVGYGVETASQGLGYATEGTRACVDWALSQPGVHTVTATTLPWHRASLRVIEKLGMHAAGTRQHDVLGELLVFAIER